MEQKEANGSRAVKPSIYLRLVLVTGTVYFAIKIVARYVQDDVADILFFVEMPFLLAALVFMVFSVRNLGRNGTL